MNALEESGQRRPRLDYVSPLPPVRSGIADYSRDLLPLLAPRCDLRVVRLPGQPLDGELAVQWAPVEAAEVGKDGRLPLYQMGNNIHHREVMELALDRPGIVVLHDLLLHHLLIELTLAREDFESYQERLVADHGWIGGAVAKARYWGELGNAAQFGLAASRTLLRRQRGVLVHSAWAVEEIGLEDSELEVRAIPMAIPLPEVVSEEAAREFRERFKLPLDAPLLGSFGFQTPIKRTDRAIAALARPELESAHLLIAGEVGRDYRLEQAAREAGVADRVHLVGFLDYEDFEAGIAACDLCLNLRYPSAGETSASLLRVLAVGRPAIVSRYGQFADFPDAVAVKVPLGDGEVEGLASEVGRLLAEPEALSRMGQEARDYIVENHDPGSAADAVVAACLELGGLEPPGDRPSRSRPSTLTHKDAIGELQVEGADDPWVEGERRELVVRLENGSDARWLAASEGDGGLILEIRWGTSPDDFEGEADWLPLEAELLPGATREFPLELRRPLGLRTLEVRYHLTGPSGLNVMAGPSWTRTFSES